MAGSLFAAAAWLLFRQWRGRLAAVETSLVSVVFALLIVVELMVASLARHYPFGGLLRHPDIAAPFLLLAAFVAVGTNCRPGRTEVTRCIFCTPPGCGCCKPDRAMAAPDHLPGRGNFAGRIHRLAVSFSRHPRRVPLPLGVIGYFIHTNDRPRRFVRRIPDEVVIDQYHVPNNGSDGTEIFYDKTRDNLDLRDPSVYLSFAACLRGSGVKKGSAYSTSPPAQSPCLILNRESLVTQKAAEQGLAITKMVVSRHHYWPVSNSASDRFEINPVQARKCRAHFDISQRNPARIRTTNSSGI